MATLTAPTMPAPTTAAPSPRARPQLYRLSVAQYHEMARRGILTAADRVELLDGLLVQKMTKNPPHTLATQLTREAVERPLPNGWFVNVQEPVTTATSEPEPDVSIIRGERRQFGTHHPSPKDVAAAIEVADSSLADDQGWKKQVYAAASIAVYWIVNLVDCRVEVYTEPTGPADQPGYRQRRDYGPTEEVPLVLDGKEVARIPVRELLP
jgi:Uma2 family endonuclease